MATTSNYDYIAELELDTSTNLYNLFITTFNGSIPFVNIQFFFCERQHIGRLDKVSSDIYNTSDWTGTLGLLNDILNPHSIREGDILAFLPESDFQNLKKVPELIRQSGELISEAKSDLINALKKKRPDSGRRNFQNNRPSTDSLPPSVLPDNSPQSVVENNKIKIAPNLFNNPNSVVSVAVSTATGSNDLNTSLSGNGNTLPIASDDEIERVLINRYIKKIS